jgi:hypothetical protein
MQQEPPTPTIGIFVSDDPDFAEHVDAHMAGFGALIEVDSSEASPPSGPH